jgi:fibronectin-binding autotransporter adhesin
MRRALAASFALLAFGWLSGCGGGPSISSLGGGPTSAPGPLHGQYAFLLSGFDKNGASMAMAGSLTADGKGNITAGVVDVNDNEVAASKTPLTGTYTLNSLGQGTITLTNTSFGPVTSALAFSFVLQNSGAFGDIMDTSGNNFVIAGTMQQQNSAIFSSFSGLAPNWIITLNGRTSTSSPTSVLGRFTLSVGGAVSAIAFDRSIAGAGSAGPTVGGNASMTFAAAPDTNGRGTFTVNITDSLAATAQSFAYYAISANRIIAVENDANGTMTADASSQSALTAGSVNTTGAVFGISGIDTAALPSANEISAIGQLVISSSTATVIFDSNDNGGIGTNLTLGPGAVTFDSTTNIGRGTIGVPSGSADGLANTLVFYLSSSGNGFLLDGTNTTSNRAMAGTLTAQTGSPFSINTDFASNAVFRGRGISANDNGVFVGLFGASTTTPFVLTGEQRFPNGTGGVTTQPATIGAAASLASAVTGRGTLNTGSELLSFYVIGPNQFVFINITSGEGSSPLFFASPQ